MDQGPEIPSPTLIDIGKGRRFLRARRAAALERRDGAGWTVVGRYGSVRDAGDALDREVARGADGTTLRVTPEPTGRGPAIAWALVAIAVVAWLVILYVLLIR